MMSPVGDGDDELKSERFNMFISKSEMEAIDEWRFEHRVGSRSEAVRRMCKVAIETTDLVEQHGTRATKIFRILNKKYKADVAPTKSEIYAALSVLASLSVLADRARPFISGGNFEELMKEEADLHALFNSDPDVTDLE